jgi:hypothetical protein
MTHDELRRGIQGPIATVPTAFDGQYALDTMAALAERRAEQCLVAGTTIIKVTAAIGGGPGLSDTARARLGRASG